MDWENDYQPALSAEEYRQWMVQAFHDKVWQNAIIVRALSTEQYVQQVVQSMGRIWLSDVLLATKDYIRRFEGANVSSSIGAETSAMNLEFFRDAEKRLHAVVRYCLDHDAFPGNDKNISIPRGHPTESVQIVDRDPMSHEILGSKTVYKFD